MEAESKKRPGETTRYFAILCHDCGNSWMEDQLKKEYTISGISKPFLRFHLDSEYEQSMEELIHG
jgi:hypothetical protein